MSTERSTESRAVLPAYRFLKPPQSADEIGRLGDYRVLELLGSGGMAFVFLAEDPALQRQVALKVIKPALADDPAICQRFLREARALASINHENVVSVHQVCHEGDTLFLAMERLRGQTLDDRVLNFGPPSESEILRIARETASGLQAIHDQGLVHRDLKPNNLWLEAPDGRVKLLDFGLARPMEEEVCYTASGLIVGTPAFMSPEQARGERLDQRSDLFSFGCVLYYLCTGDLPFRAGTSVGMLTAVALDTPRPIRACNSSIRPELEALVLRLLEKEANNRPRSARDVQDQIREIETGLKPASVPAESPTRLPRADQFDATVIEPATTLMVAPPLRRSRLLPTVAILVACLLSAAGTYFAFIAKDSSSARASKPNGDMSGSHEHSESPSGLLVLDNCDDRPGTKGDHLSYFDATGQLKFRIDGFGNCSTVANAHMIAVDRSRGHIWVIENAARRVRRFDFSGKETLEIDGVNGTAVAIDPETGNLWAVVGGDIGENHTVAVYNVDGKVLKTIQASGYDISYDPFSKAFWVVGSRATKILAASGESEFSVRISTWFASTVAIDSKDGSAWVVTRGLFERLGDRDRLLKFDPNGRELANIDLGQMLPLHLTIDPVDSSVWVAFRQKPIEHFAADGTHLGDIGMTATAVQTGSGKGDIWVVSPNSVQLLNSSGAVVSKASHVRRTGQAWVSSVN